MSQLLNKSMHPEAALSTSIAKPGELLGASSHRSRLFPIAALLLLTLATSLRLYHLGDRSLWFDEAVTANISQGTVTQVLEETRLVSAPVVHPYILYVVQKVGKGAVAVRLPSVLASLLAVLMMLVMVRAKVSYNAALFSAAIFAVSASQIRYAQEVREYSLTVLWAVSMIYCLLRWEAGGRRNRHLALLYVTFFFAPLIQYGLVFLAFGILATICMRLLLSRDTCFRLSHAMIASAFLAAGGLLSFAFTVRYQVRPRGIPWYLVSNYFDSRTTSLLHFLGKNTKGLLSFFIPGQLIALCFVLAAIVFCVAQATTRKYETITLLVFTSLLITICASLARIYPYGGVRQCLFLAPGLTLFAGVAFADLLQRLRVSARPAATIGVLALILLSGYRGLLKQWPYGEYEDTLSILKELSRSSTPNDQVWVNHDAVPALEFYLQGRDNRFIYGKFHKDPQEYVPELLGSIDRHDDRLWLVFSHLQQPSDRAEEQLIVSSLRSGWDVEPVIAPTNTALYVAHRTTSP
jgi:uncharacterized membrane protein